LPFLQKTLNEFEIVPILLGDVSPQSLSEILMPYFGKDNNLFVFSSDLSHYQPYIIANKTDAHSLKIITRLDVKDEDAIDACGNLGIKVAMRLTKNTGRRINLLNYRNSGDTAGDKDAVVGYASLTITD
jgi:MEMO1 family protein